MGTPTSVLPLPSPPHPFVPARWARGGHAQTLGGYVLRVRGAPRLALQDLRIELRDGDALSAGHHPGRTDAAFYLFHGLGGSAASEYVRRFGGVLAHRGHHVYLIDHRGCGAGAGLATKPYMCGRIEDLADVVAFGRARHPAARHVVVGFSLSGMTLLKLLATAGEEHPDAALALCPPVDLEVTSRALLAWPERLYDLYLLRRCRRWIGEIPIQGRAPAEYAVPALSNLRVFDERYIAPASGFASRDEYYRAASARDDLERVRTPTLVLTALDDPMSSPACLVAAPRSTSIQLHVEQRGGHMGFLAARRTPLGSRRWADYALDHYASELLARL